jgi:tetratricopeptide (TPR) repeat protein
LANVLDNLLESAVAEHRRGDLAAAVEKYRTILAVRPDDWNAVYLHGTALLQLGHFHEAIDVLESVAAQRPGVADVYNNIGVAHQALSNWERAAAAYEAAIRARPDYHLPRFNLGRLLEARGLFPHAEKHFRAAVARQPDGDGYRLRLADVLGQQAKWSDAEEVLRQAVRERPEDLDACVNLAYALLKLERLEEAAEVYRSVLAKRPDYHQVHNNLAFVLDRQGRLDEALDAAQRAVELQPGYAEGFNNLGSMLRSMHRIDEACEAFRRAIALEPDFALAEFNLGTTRLLAGNYGEGWAGYSRHAQVAGTQAPGPADSKWAGQPIPGKRLLAYDDQGFGDAIQFVRFLPKCREQSRARISLRCAPRLVRLFSTVAGVDEIIPNSAPLPPFDFHAALADLPRLFGVTLEAGLGSVPYLSAPANSRSPAVERVRSFPAAGVRVGVVWQGNRLQTLDVVRSCPLEKFRLLFQTERVSFFSLQLDDAERQQIARLGLRERVVDLGGLLGDFADTAAVLAELDLLIAVDTAVAHLAGAMGRPCWTLLCHTPDWRWHLDRSDSPWYPSMRLFRHPRWGDWDAVVADVAAELRRHVADCG